MLQVIEGREEMDWKRHSIFVTFGFLYLGGFQYYLYNVKFSQVGFPGAPVAFNSHATDPRGCTLA